MVDYIEISNSLHKGTPNLTLCNRYTCRMNDFGYETYEVEGCKRMQFLWNPQTKIYQLKGTLPYFLKGHNFSFSREEYIESIELLQDILQVGLWDAAFNVLEYGAIFSVEKSPKDYIKNHTAKKKSRLNENLRGKDKGSGKWWSCPEVILKMYDAGKNIQMKQKTPNRTIIESDGYNPNMNYLKFEAHYRKPFLLNGCRDILVEDLQNPQGIQQMNETLLSQYHLLNPMRELLKPTNKKELSATDIVVREFVKELINDGKTIGQAQEQIYQSIREADCLNQPDKDSRRRTIKEAFKKLQEAEDSEWDLTSRIQESLENENKPKFEPMEES